ncbi:chemotaxis protein CheW [Fictibacillus sp. B-59209]|uniref:chemotaxis protein CheW n=1 Tax=Fictibacillus sp. B-59209 TaxID=3024873 RepID=UPI002E1F6308|nr:chemotaxis protein CheW [Fictibacillus sp. B-59209]
MNGQEIKVIVFQLENEEYGVDVHQVKSIERVSHITRIPRTPGFVKGVINLRGIVTPIIDLRSRFEMEEKQTDENTRIIIVNTDEMEVGLIVDSANDVLDIPTADIEPTPEVAGGINAEYLDGVAKIGDRLLILLQLDKVLNKEEVTQLHLIGNQG